MATNNGLFFTIRLNDVDKCNSQCEQNSKCNFYRYNRQTQNCTFLTEQDRSGHCKISAGPKDTKDTECLNVENEQECDFLLQEECEYGMENNGDLVIEYPDGAITSADSCQMSCQDDFPDCKYWIFDKKKNLCILRKSEERKCAFVGGPQLPTHYDCRKLSPNW